MAQLVALMSGVVQGGVAEVVGSNLARGKIFTASIGSVDSLYHSVYIYTSKVRIKRYIEGVTINNYCMFEANHLFCAIYIYILYFIKFPLYSYMLKVQFQVTLSRCFLFRNKRHTI